jgi:hypothetical protein
MKCYRTLSLILLSSVFLFAVSCKKKSNGISLSDQRIAYVDYSHHGEIEHYHFIYDQNNNVDSINITGDGTALGHNGFKRFEYIGSSFIITKDDGSSFKVYANTSGQIIEVLVADTLLMYYKGTQITEQDVKSPIAAYPYYTLTPTYFTWTGGDITYVGPAGSGGQTYYYDRSLSGQPGDVFRIDAFLSFGRSYTKNARLAIGTISGTDTLEKYSYHFDPLGRIDTLRKVDVSTGIYDTTIYAYKYY